MSLIWLAAMVMKMRRFLISFSMFVLLFVSACGTSSPNQVVPTSAPPPSTSSASTDSVVPAATGIPEGAVKIEIPTGIPTPEGTEVWVKEVNSQELLNNLATRGWALCPNEQIELFEEGIQIACPGTAPDVNLAQVGTIAGSLAMSDSPAVPIMDAVAVVYIVVVAGVAISQVEWPQVVFVKDPAMLPDVVVPPGVVAPPEHISNHPRGEYLAKLKSLGWILVWSMWSNAQNGGPKPDWCGRRASDGALLIAYYSAQVISSTGRIYNGFGIIVNMGGANMSTVLTKVAPPAPGEMPTSGNSSGNDFEQFEQLPPDLCPPPPLQVAQ